MAILVDRTFDNSMLQDAQVCKRKFYWRYVRQLVTRRTSSALAFGGAIHEGLAMYYDPELRPLAAEKEERGEKGWEALEWAATQAFHNELNERESWAPEDEPYRTAGYGEEILKLYFEQYPIQHEAFEVIQKEINFVIDLPYADNINWGGVIDLIIKGGYGVDILDHKTSKDLGTTFFDQFLPSMQMPGYVHAARELVGECAGAWVNVLQTAKKKREFARQRFEYSDVQLDTIMEQAGIQAAELMISVDIADEAATSAGRMFPASYDMCTKFYGECPYRPLCLTFKPPEEVIPGDLTYIVEEWAPWQSTTRGSVESS